MGITIPSLHVLARNAARWLWGLTHPPPRQPRRVCTVCPQRRTHGGAGAACYAHLRATPFVALARNSPPSPPTGSRPLTRATHSGLHRLSATPNTRRGGGCVLRAPAGYALCRARSQLPALAPYGVAPANAGDALGAAPSVRNAEHTEGRGLRATRTCGLRPLSRSLATPRPRPLRGRAR